MGHVLAFAAVAIVMIVTPGPDTTLIVRNTLVGGRSNGVRTALGVVTRDPRLERGGSGRDRGVVAASHPLFVAIRLGGAIYLVWLGIGALRAAISGDEPAPVMFGGRRSGYRQGLLSNLGNPEAAVVFTQPVAPVRVQPRRLARARAALLGDGDGLADRYALAVARAQRLLLRAPVRRALDAVMGSPSSPSAHGSRPSASAPRMSQTVWPYLFYADVDAASEFLQPRLRVPGGRSQVGLGGDAPPRRPAGDQRWSFARAAET